MRRFWLKKMTRIERAELLRDIQFTFMHGDDECILVSNALADFSTDELDVIRRGFDRAILALVD